MSDVPEINGKPAAKVFWSQEEKVGFPNYSNVTIGASISRFVEDDIDDGGKKLSAAFKATEAAVEAQMEDAREQVGELLAKAQKS